MSAPLRFLAASLGGWACLRGAALLPWPPAPGGAVAEAAPASLPAAVGGPADYAAPARPGKDSPEPLAPEWASEGPPTVRAGRPAYPTVAGSARSSVHEIGTAAAAWRPADLALAPPVPALPGPAEPQPPPGRAGRWSLSAWAFGRPGGTGLAPAPSLGGSQAGARLGYRVAGSAAAPLSLTLRLSSPLRAGTGGEAALGLDWRPSARLPVRLAVERREALGKSGRSGFAVYAHGGVSGVALGSGFRLDGYGQAGAVGGDLFGDGGARLTRRLGAGFAAGAGAWGAGQPGAYRFDLGPTVSIPLRGGRAAIAIDWRHRVAGNARPGSGPALTVSSEF